MKHLKKAIALVLTVVTAFAMATPAFAADEEPAATGLTADKEISVTGLTAGDAVKYYQVLKFDGDWKLAEGFTSLASNEKFAVGAATRDEAAVVADIVDGITQEQANEIAKLAASATAKGNVDSLEGTEFKAEPSAAGLYMVIATAKTAGTLYNPAFVGSDFDKDNGTHTIAITATYDNNGAAKKQTITVDKKTKEKGENEQYADSNVGDIVPFTVTTKIPVFLDSYTKPSFMLTDQVSAGLELIQDEEHPVTIAYGSATTTKTNTDVTLTVTTGASGNVVADFAEAYLKKNATGTTAIDVTLTYYAKVTNAAISNVNTDENTVTVEYSNGPGEEKGYLKDATEHYTFSLGAKVMGDSSVKESGYEIVKVGRDKNGNPVEKMVKLYDKEEKIEEPALAGATFGLFTDTQATKPYKNDLYPNGAQYTTTADGIIKFNGLDSGTYYLKEISAPAGYVADSQIHTVVIDATYSEKTITEEVNGVDVTYKTMTLDSYTVTMDGKTDKADTFTFKNEGTTQIKPDKITIKPDEIVNTKGQSLPSTGGMGTKILYTIGGLMVVAGGVFLAAKKRMSTIEE